MHIIPSSSEPEAGTVLLVFRKIISVSIIQCQERSQRGAVGATAPPFLRRKNVKKTYVFEGYFVTAVLILNSRKLC